MPLDPHVSRLVGMLGAASRSDASRLTLAERREAFQKLMRLSDSKAAIGEVRNRELPGPAGMLPVRIYTPVAAGEAPLPGLVYFHGGGFVAGSLDTHDGVCRSLANESGARVISIGYRLAPEHPFPAAVQDACGAAT